MFATRHNLDLKLGRRFQPIIAPRRFIIDNKIIYVHIVDAYCQYVQLFDHLRYVNNTCAMVAISNALKLYSNTKGLYFNYSYWVDNYTKKTIRIYLCD